MQYVVQAGDTLTSIAQRFGTTVEAIVRANNISNPNLIFVGQVLTIPTGGAPAPTPPTPPAPTPPAPGLCPTLQRGSRGAAVIRLQNLLRNAGFDPGPSDGIFGARTESAVREFQRRRGIPVTGVVNVRTWTALGVNCVTTPQPPTPPAPEPPQIFCPVLRSGDRGPAVRLLQTLLRDRGFYRGAIDGVFGARTERAVREFQRREGLTVTGVVTGPTWRALGVTCQQVPTPPTGTPIATAVGRGIRHILFTDKRVYNRGENVKITLLKTNITDEEINLRYRTSQIVEITATSGAGRVVWRFSTGRQFTQATRLITIFPGGTQVIENTWNQLSDSGPQVPSGTYTITITNLATNVSLSVQIQIR